MVRPLCSCAGLLVLFLFLIDLTSADPQLDLQLRAVRPSACQEHMNLHRRMDAVEKRVEASVDKLEADLNALLVDIEDRRWSPLLKKTGQTAVDILQDPEQRVSS